jgi:hypothetical protein
MSEYAEGAQRFLDRAAMMLVTPGDYEERVRRLSEWALDVSAFLQLIVDDARDRPAPKPSFPGDEGGEQQDREQAHNHDTT